MVRVAWKETSWWRRLLPAVPKAPLPYEHGLLSKGEFTRKLVQERKRAERSAKPLLVMLVDARSLGSLEEREGVCRMLGERIRLVVRETDSCGTLEEGILGVILTEVAPEKVAEARHAVSSRTKEKLVAMSTDIEVRDVPISFRVYPESGGAEEAFDKLFFPELMDKGIGEAGELTVKRVIDLVGSVLSILFLGPILLLLPVAIKVDSRGPVLFAQERMGLNGRRFRLFKFRTMQVGNRDDIHREYVKKLIEGKVDQDQTVFKITADPRVTGVGKLLRKYSLDELPQLFNVLAGDMSLVGPRPPIPYEVEHYSAWQRNRLIGKKPGITGAWQVSGRSSTNFDEMVRLDLRYMRGWSVVLDLKIILQTPLAVLRCRGAY